MRERFNRPLNMGDLVLFNNSNNSFKDIRYGLIAGENVIYSNGQFYRRVSCCFKVNTPCPAEQDIYNELVHQFQQGIKGNKKVDKSVDSENYELGGLYIQNDSHTYYLYLGEVNLYNSTHTLLDSSKDVFLAVSAYFNPNILDVGNEGIYSDLSIFKEFLNRELGSSIRDKNGMLVGYPHLKFSKRKKKFLKKVGRIDFPVGLIGSQRIKVNNSCYMEFKGVQ